MEQPPAEKSKPTTLHTVERAFSFLEFVAGTPEPMTVREVAQGLGLNITTAYHLYNTLSSLGYLSRDAGMRLTVGARVTALNHAYRKNISLQRELIELIEALALTTRETASVSWLTDNRIVIQAVADGPQPNRAAGLYVGLAGLEHKRASGRLILAFSSAKQRDAILEKSLSDETSSQRAAIIADLESRYDAILQQGWADDLGEFQADISGVAAPIHDASGAVVGAINVSSPAARFQPQKERLVAAALEAGRTASRIQP